MMVRAFFISSSSPLPHFHCRRLVENFAWASLSLSAWHDGMPCLPAFSLLFSPFYYFLVVFILFFHENGKREGETELREMKKGRWCSEQTTSTTTTTTAGRKFTRRGRDVDGKWWWWWSRWLYKKEKKRSWELFTCLSVNYMNVCMCNISMCTCPLCIVNSANNV